MISFQKAMVGATAYPNPIALLPPADLEEATGGLDEARKWADGLRVMVERAEMSVAAGEGKEELRREVEKWTYVLQNLKEARDYALEHVKKLDDAKNRRAARKSAGRQG
jgi:tRNA-dihydrouridine synthase